MSFPRLVVEGQGSLKGDYHCFNLWDTDCCCNSFNSNRQRESEGAKEWTSSKSTFLEQTWVPFAIHQTITSPGTGHLTFDKVHPELSESGESRLNIGPMNWKLWQSGWKGWRKRERVGWIESPSHSLHPLCFCCCWWWWWTASADWNLTDGKKCGAQLCLLRQLETLW